MTPLGDAQEKCSHLPLPVSLWVFTQSLPPLVKVRHDVLAGSSFPPQVTGPVCVWPYLGCGNVGMGQFQVPSMFSSSTESSTTPPFPLPPLTITTEDESPTKRIYGLIVVCLTLGWCSIVFALCLLKTYSCPKVPHSDPSHIPLSRHVSPVTYSY